MVMAWQVSGVPCTLLWVSGVGGHPLWGHCKEMGAVGLASGLHVGCAGECLGAGRNRGAGRRADCPGAISLWASGDSPPALACFLWRGHAAG